MVVGKEGNVLHRVKREGEMSGGEEGNMSEGRNVHRKCPRGKCPTLA